MMERERHNWRNIYILGWVMSILVLFGILLDLIAGSVTGGNVSTLPSSAVDRFYQLRDTRLLGLYNLDLLNVIIQLLLVPVIFALYAVHRRINKAFALLALLLFLLGTAIFVSGNTAMTMLDLSHKYFACTNEMQKSLYAAAGEAMLAKGSHGSLSVFFGFLIPTFANLLMSWVMYKGKIFNKITSWAGFYGNILMIVYLMVISFFPSTSRWALVLAMPGGLLLMAWMVLFTIKLYKISSSEAIPGS